MLTLAEQVEQLVGRRWMSRRWRSWLTPCAAWRWLRQCRCERDFAERLTDIRNSAGRALPAVDVLQRASASGDHDEEQIAFDALLYRLLVIGEAVKALRDDLLHREPKVPWREVSRLRDLLAHHYYRADPQTIRRTVDAPLRELQEAAQHLLEDLTADDS